MKEIYDDLIKLKISNLSNPKSNEFINKTKQIVGKSFIETEFKELIESRQGQCIRNQYFEYQLRSALWDYAALRFFSRHPRQEPIFHADEPEWILKLFDVRFGSKLQYDYRGSVTHIQQEIVVFEQTVIPNIKIRLVYEN